MKPALALLYTLLSIALSGYAYGHFTGKGHVHTRSETKQEFLNPDCQPTGTCDLKRFSLTTAVNEIWFSDDPDHPTYSNGVIMEYETDSVPALEKYAIVQFKKGCVFYTSETASGVIKRSINSTVFSFGESVPYCFRNWIIDSQDADPAYNSDPAHGRIYLARWNRPGSYDNQTQRFYGVQKPTRPVIYMTDYPSGAFVRASGVKNTALEFKTCIYKASEVPAVTRRDDIDFAKPIHCFDWQNVYIYDFKTARFQTDLALAPTWDEPAPAVAKPSLPLVGVVAMGLALIALVLLLYRRRRHIAG